MIFKKISFSLSFILAFQCFSWAWTYKKDINIDSSKKVFIFSRKTQPFKQLIFSWNAIRPSKGFFKFFVSVHTSKGWSKFFEMADWGFNVQRSYLDKDGRAGFYHVRLEVTQDKADAFKIKVVSHDAQLSLLKSVTVAVCDKSSITPESYADLKHLPNVFIKNIPSQSQIALKHEDSDKICSPTSLAMLIGYLSRKKQNPIKIAKNSFDNGLQVYGSWPFNTAHAFELYPKCNFSVVRLSSFKDLHAYLVKGVPVVVSIRGKLRGAAKDYPQGHLVLVYGWNKYKKLVYVHDPAFDRDYKVKHAYKVDDFLKAWERSHRLAYVADC